MDIAAIRAGIETALSDIDGLKVYGIAPANLQPPALVVNSDDPFINYYSANAKGLAQLNLKLTIYVARQDDKLAQQRLDQYLASGTGATKSIIDALEADPSLDGAAQTSKVESVSAYQSWTDSGGASLAGVELSFTVYASRN